MPDSSRARRALVIAALKLTHYQYASGLAYDDLSVHQASSVGVSGSSALDRGLLGNRGQELFGDASEVALFRSTSS